MDFFRKGVQAAKNVAQQVKEAVDEREFTSGGMKGGASTDGDFNACVQHFVALNTSLKQVGTKAKEMMNSIKAQGQAALIFTELLEGTCETEFGEESHWSNAAMTLRNMNQEVDSKFNTQLIALLQRDILDKIAAELESNNEIKATIDARRAQPDVPRDADPAMQKISGVIRRRKMLLATCLTALMSHQYNYHTRLADKCAPLKPLVTESKTLLGDPSASVSSSSSSSLPSSPARPTPTPQSPPRPAPAPAAAPAAQAAPPPQAAPAAPPKQQPPAPPPKEPVKEPAPEPEMARPQSAEPVDLLGLGDDSPQPVPEKKAAPKPQGGGGGGGGSEGGGGGDLLGLDVPAVPAAAAKVKSPSGGDIFDNLFGDKPTNKMPSKGPFTREGSFKGAKTDDLFPEIGASSPVKTAARAKDTGDLLDFGASPRGDAGNDPLNDLFGPSHPLSPKNRPKPSGGDTPSINAGHTQEDDRDRKPIVQQKPRASREGDFKGEGTDRAMLKAQFEQHIQDKAAAAAEQMRLAEEERARYEDLKFASQDQIKAKVDAWAGPKHNRKNLRAMLASFDTILWDSAKEKWGKKGLHELVMPDQVKKIHRKAVLVVHPDKVHNQSTEVKLLAEEVQGVLQTALEEFRKKEPC